MPAPAAMRGGWRDRWACGSRAVEFSSASASQTRRYSTVRERAAGVLRFRRARRILSRPFQDPRVL